MSAGGAPHGPTSYDRLKAQHRANEEERERARGARAHRASVRRHNEDQARAYNAGKRGEEFPFEGENDELYELYNQGHTDREAAEAERQGRPASTRSVGRRRSSSRSDGTRRRARGVIGATRRAARAVETGGAPSVLGVLGLMLGLVLLYLLLSNAKVLASAVSGVQRFVLWLVDPTKTIGAGQLPSLQGGGS